MEQTETQIQKYERYARTRLARLIEAGDEARQRFVQEVQEDGIANAIRWSGQTLVTDEHMARHAGIVLSASEEVSLLAAMQVVRNQIQLRLTNLYNGGGGNLYTQANEGAQRYAESRMYDLLNDCIGAIEEAQAEEQQQEELREGATDVTEYALRATKIQLLGQLEDHNRVEATAKSKRDQVAAATAADAVSKSIANIEALAETLGVNVN